MTAPWFKYYPADWRSDPKLRMCSLSARGLWMEMLCLMHEAEPRGSLVVNGVAVNEQQLASLVGSSIKEVGRLQMELEMAGVFSRDSDGVIFSRRMRRDDEKAKIALERGNLGGNPQIRRGTVAKEDRVRPFKRSDAPVKTRRIFDRAGGRCHWCSEAISWEGFHVDHVLPICDGGSNDEANLVAACADCNHKRARLAYPTASPVNVGIVSDSKAQNPEARSQGINKIHSGNAARGHPAFPVDGSIAYSEPFASIARKSRPGIDVDILASGFRKFCFAKDISFDDPKIDAKFGSFCLKHQISGLHS